MLRILMSCLLALIYWVFVVRFLEWMSPVFMDGEGPWPSFYWGDTRFPDLGEYFRHRYYYDFMYHIPYCVAGMIATLCGGGVSPWFVRRSRMLRSQPFISGTATTLVLTLLLALASDVGIRIGWWSGPLFLLHTLDAFDIAWLVRVFFLIAVLGGFVTWFSVHVRPSTNPLVSTE
jgi:hypothetical protein